jgi:hypothetical protein
MAKSFNTAPELPKVHRRIGRDLTEGLVTLLALACSIGIFAVAIRRPKSWFDISNQGEYDFLLNALIASSVILWILVVRLDFSAKSRAEMVYKTKMKEYEIMRETWLEIASEKMVFEAKKSTQVVEVVKESEPIIVKVPEPEKKSDK